MDNKKRISINDAPVFIKAILFLLPVISVFLVVKCVIDNDFYFLYPTGEYLINNGFPTTDFLSMHNTMDITVQQWLSTIIFYYAYSLFGKVGIYALNYLFGVVISLIMFKLYSTVSKNFFVSVVCSLFSTLYISLFFITSRPHLFTFTIIALELLCLEKYVQTKKLIYLLFLPVFSILLINLHSSMWMMLFVFMAPYFAEALPIKIGKIKQTPCCSFIALLVCAVVCVACGFINPYGAKAMTYILTSFGYEEISNLIVEMLPVSAKDSTGWIFFFYIGAMICSPLLYNNRKLTTRYTLLFLGTLVLSLSTFKSSSYFIIAGFMAVAYAFSDFSFDLVVDNDENKNSGNKKTRILLIVAIIVMLIVTAVALVFTSESSSEKAQKVTSYDILDEITEILEQENKDDIILYTGFDYGQYMEFKGYHPYIDGRAELYLKDNNHEFDYMKEYYDLKLGNLYYKEFLNKYNFNYLVVTSGDRILYHSLLNDKDYEVVYTKTTSDGKADESKAKEDNAKKSETISLFALKDK